MIFRAGYRKLVGLASVARHTPHTLTYGGTTHFMRLDTSEVPRKVPTMYMIYMCCTTGAYPHRANCADNTVHTRNSSNLLLGCYTPATDLMSYVYVWCCMRTVERHVPSTLMVVREP